MRRNCVMFSMSMKLFLSISFLVGWIRGGLTQTEKVAQADLCAIGSTFSLNCTKNETIFVNELTPMCLSEQEVGQETTNCTITVSLSYVKSICDGNQSCTVEALLAVSFGADDNNVCVEAPLPVKVNASYICVSNADDDFLRYNDTASVVTNTLRNISLVVITPKNVKTVARMVAIVTSYPHLLTVDAVIFTSKILENIANVEGGVDTETATDVLKALNNILTVNETVIKDAENTNQSSTRLTRAVDTLTDVIQLDNTTTSLVLVQPEIAVLIWDSNKKDDEQILGIQYSQNNDEKLSNMSFSPIKKFENRNISASDTSIVLPLSAIRPKDWAGKSRVSFLLYRERKLFQSQYELQGSSGNGSKYTAYSRVISAKINTRLNRSKLDSPLVATFLPARTGFKSDSAACGFWDYSLSKGQGDWSTEGCWYNGSKGDSHICMCNHLTNFALLLDIAGQNTPLAPEHQQALETISVIGLSLSIIGLSFTVLTFLLFRCRVGTGQTYSLTSTRLRRGRDQDTLFHLSVALLCSMIVFLAGVKQTGNYGGCIAVAVLLHYFILVTFMWMLMEGILQYLRFVKVMGTYIPRFMLKAAIPARGIPAVICGVVLSIDYKLYNEGDTYCWLSRSAFYYAFLIPVGIIILANIVVFILVLRGITCTRAKGLRTNQSEMKQALLQFNCAMCCLLLLGCTWVFGFFAIGEARLLFQYLFCIFNTLQGFFIFILFNIRDKQVREAWFELCGKTLRCKKGEEKAPDTQSTTL